MNITLFQSLIVIFYLVVFGLIWIFFRYIIRLVKSIEDISDSLEDISSAIQNISDKLDGNKTPEDE